MGFEFDLDRKRLRRRERRGVHDAFTGIAGAYGEVTIIITSVPQRAELTSTTLPSAWILHPPPTRQGLVRIDDTTRLVVGEQEAKLAQNRRALGKEDRALHIQLDDRQYEYRATTPGAEELRDTMRGPVFRVRRPAKVMMRITVLPEADPTDIALGLILQGADMNNLTLTRTVLSNVWYFFNNGEGPM